MRMVRSVISRYIFKEMLPPFTISVAFFTFIFVLTRILEITSMIVNYKVGLLVVARMMLFTIPYFLVYVIPMSVMMSVLLTFLRMSADNEIVALRAGGVSLYQLLPPVVGFCLFGALMTGWMIIDGLPWGKRSARQLLMEIAVSHADAGLKERTFNDAFKDVMLYVNQIDLKTNTLTDVFIEDQRTPHAVITVTAPKGMLYKDPDKAMFRLALYHGTVNQTNLEKRSVNVIHFDTYEISLDLRKTIPSVGSGPTGTKEMSLAELRQYINQCKDSDESYYLALLEFHKKFSIPFACLSMGILAVPLGIRSKSARRSVGLAVGLASFLCYYLLLSVGQVLGETGVYPPVVGMWVPNLVTGGMGLYLLRKSET